MPFFLKAPNGIISIIYTIHKEDPSHCINELHRHLGKNRRRKIFRNVDVCINLSHSFWSLGTLTRAYGHILLSLGISCIKRRKHIHGKLDRQCGSCKACLCHTQRRKAHFCEVTFPALLLFKGSDTTDLRAEATRMGSSFGEVESGRLGNPILPAECYGQGAWQSLLFEAEMILEGWRRAEELLGSFFPKSFFFRFQAGLPKYIILSYHNTKVWRSLGMDFMFCTPVTEIQRMMLFPRSIYLCFEHQGVPGNIAHPSGKSIDSGVRLWLSESATC